MTTPNGSGKTDPITPRVGKTTAPKTAPFIPGKAGAKTTIVPALPTDAKSRDEIRDKLVTWYARLGTVAGKLNRLSLAAALTDQAETCADAWMRVAEKNASVRRFVFAINEGNAWIELVMAHTPILLATLPESALDRLMGQFTAALFSAGNGATELPDDNLNGDGGQSH